MAVMNIKTAAMAAALVMNFANAESASVVPFPVLPTEIPDGPQGDLVRLGEHLVRETGKYAPHYVGNSLACANCHLDNGKKPFAAPFVGLPGIFPLYLPRDKTVISLADRINGCFMRSMNGKPLPLDSKEMMALTVYMGWLSQGVPAGHEVDGRGFEKVKKTAGYIPDTAHGKAVFEANCAMCHGADGQGKQGENVSFPPLWGQGSYNDGAGMSKPDVAVRFIQKNMPFDRPGSLSIIDASDVAAFIDSQPRPHFAGVPKKEDAPGCHP